MSSDELVKKACYGSIKYVNTTIKYSSNSPHRLNCSSDSINQKRRRFEKFINSNWWLFYSNSQIKNKYISDIGQYGNCGEMAIIAKFWLEKNYPNLSVKCYEIVNGDHCFLRVENFICDPWAQAVYPISKVNQNLKDWDSWFGKIRDYDPENQFICEKNTKFNDIFYQRNKFWMIVASGITFVCVVDNILKNFNNNYQSHKTVGLFFILVFFLFEIIKPIGISVFLL